MVLSGKKKALRIDKVIKMIAPLLPEFSLERGLEMFKDDSNTMLYISDATEQSRPLDRNYVYSIFTSFHPNYMASMLEAARNSRYVDRPLRANYVEVHLCQEFEKLLLDKPYVSSKKQF